MIIQKKPTPFQSLFDSFYKIFILPYGLVFRRLYGISDVFDWGIIVNN